MKYRSRWQIVDLIFSKLFFFVFLILNTLVAFAGPSVTTYQAKIIKPDGLPLEAASVNFKFTILDPTATCILYSETYSAVNMNSTGGLISFSLGSGIKSYPASATTFAEVFSNVTANLSCDAGGPVSYSPAADDSRKIVMQFHDGSGWQTLPAMNINAVPYAMYANEAQKLSGLPTCNPGEALGYNGVSFSCEAISGGGVTSSTVIAALGYTPVQPGSLGSNNNLPTGSSNSYALGGNNTQTTGGGGSNDSLLLGFNNNIDNGGGGSNSGYVIGYNNKFNTFGGGSNEAFIFGSNNTVNYSGFVIGRGVSAPANNAIVIGNGYQTVNIMNNNRVGIGTSSPVTALDVSGGVRVGFENATCDSTLAGTLRYNGASLEYCDGSAWSGFSGSVTSSTVVTALGYTPANSATLASTISTLSTVSSSVSTANSNIAAVSSSVATANATIASVSSTVYSVSATVSSLTASASALSASVTGLTTTVNNHTTSLTALTSAVAAMAASQWTASGTKINYSAGNVGIGTANPNYRLEVSGTSKFSGTSLFGNTPATSGINFGPSLGLSATYNSPLVTQHTFTDQNSLYMIGLGSSVIMDSPTPTTINTTNFGSFSSIQTKQGNATNYAFTYGAYGYAEHAGSGNVDDVAGVGALSIANTSGTITNLRGVEGRAYVLAGSAQNAYGGEFSIINQSLTPITNGYGVKINTANGNYFNNFGLYIGDQSLVVATNAYNILSDGAGRNVFIGNTGIGTSLPLARLHLANGTSSLAPLKFTSGTLLTSPASGSVEYDGFNLYYTDGTNARRTIATTANVAAAVTSSAISTALGYTPANSSTVNSLSGTITTLQNSVASMAASQWSASGSTINFSTGNVGIGTSVPAQALDVSGTAKANKFLAGDGVFNAPSITFANNSNTGFYNAGGWLGISVGGGLKGTWTSSSLGFNAGGAGPQIYFTGGNAANPSYAFNVDSDTGMFNPNSSGGSNELGFSTSGVERVRFSAVGNVGIGTSAPAVKLNVAGDGGILAAGTYGTGNTFGASGAGTRMEWNPRKAAFRAGYVDGAQWDNVNVGPYSVAFGDRTTASGWSTIAAGEGNAATNDYAIAMGFWSTASGTNSIALGDSNQAANGYAVAIGSGNTASGSFSTALGKDTTAESYGQITLGRSNLPKGSENPNSWVTTDPLFVVGNGTGPGASRSTALMILKNGNVGIGTTTPSTLNGWARVLDVFGVAHSKVVATQAVSGVSVTTGVYAHGLTGNGYAGYPQGYGGVGLVGTETMHDLGLMTSNTTRVSITNDGLVGIGTVSPTRKLHLASTVNNEIVIEQTDALTNYKKWNFVVDSGNATTPSRFYIRQLNDALNGGNVPFTITASGSVGINTQTPGGKLEVSNNQTMISNGTGSTFRVTAPNSANSDYFQVGWLSEDNWGIMTADSATHRNLVVTPWGGNFGVGNVSPSYKLDVSGDIHITGTPYRDSGDVAWQVPSDARLKDVTGQYNRGLREIANIDTITYKYKKDNPKKVNSTTEYTGVLAQQVQGQIPEAVKTDSDGFLSLNTTPIFWAMVNAFKEVYYDIVGIKAENAQLKAQTAEQARKIQSLEEENQAIKDRLDRIEKSLQQNNK